MENPDQTMEEIEQSLLAKTEETPVEQQEEIEPVLTIVEKPVVEKEKDKKNVKKAPASKKATTDKKKTVRKATGKASDKNKEVKKETAKTRKQQVEELQKEAEEASSAS
ncbi:hypothetical protein [Neobacillus sp. D3-1R]|uniref:hypothetical protein n=1 Tax=Neobacillus sp. D3-1R TaxID=3445778 RepID=UPI003F9F0DCF